MSILITDSDKKKKVEDTPLKESLFTWSSFLHQYWFFMSLFAMNNYQQSYNVWVTGMILNNLV